MLWVDEIPAFRRLMKSSEVRMKIGELLRDERDIRLIGSFEQIVEGLSFNSKETRPGDLFFAVAGNNADGCAFVGEALERGAVAVAAQRELALPASVPLLLVDDVRRAKARLASTFYGFPSRRLKCIGVTGTNGKTTTSHMLKSILEQNGWSVGLLGTIHHLVGKETIRARTTTPDTIEIHRYLARMIDENQDAAVMEVSSHALHQARVEAVAFQAGVFTNLSAEHLDYHGGIDNYRRTKARLFAALPDSSTAILNGDDESSGFMKEACRCPVLSYGVDVDAQVRGIIRRLDIDGFSMILKSPAGEVDVTSRLLGRYNVSNALAAAAAALSLGVSLPAVKSGLEALRAVPGRVETIDLGQDFRVIVDYAHTDDALRKLLENLRELTRGRLITVFGCGGDRDAFKRPRMAAAATELSDLTVITSDNPRSEDPRIIIDDILAGCREKAPIKVLPDRRAAIELAISLARGGDIVAIAGKGHEDYQILNSGTIEFDDREVAREAIWKRSL